MSASASSSPNTAATSPIYYAEYLPNISSVTLTLSSIPQGCTFSLSPSGTSLLLTNPSSSSPQTTSVPLPAACTTTGPGLQMTTSPSSTTIRLPAPSPSPSSSTSSNNEPLIPWSATSLTSTTEFKCGSCKAVVLESGKVVDWRDLPSEGWAEMMDLWHCHKPDEHHLHNHHGDEAVGSGKGYAAGAKLVARKGVGFVDVLGLLVAEDDVGGVEIESSADKTSDGSSTQPQRVVCKSCASPLGYLDASTAGYKLLKPFLALSPPATRSASTISAPPTGETVSQAKAERREGKSESYEIEKWLSAYLLSMSASSGVRKFRFTIKEQTGVYEDGGGGGDGVSEKEVWLFNTDLLYTSSSSSSASYPTATPAKVSKMDGEHEVKQENEISEAVEAIKIFYRTLPASEISRNRETQQGGESLTRENLHQEELSLPLGLEEVLWECLERGTMVLPKGQRKFAGGVWEVCVLGRFSGCGEDV